MNLPDEQLRYPIGRFKAPEEYTQDLLNTFIREIDEAPLKLREAVAGLTDEQLNIPYRSGGWTVRQVVHHIPDSHMNAYVRMKLALTEDQPIIKSYEEHLWAQLNDSFATPISVSLDLLENLHKKWIILIRSLSSAEMEKCYRHSQWGLVNMKWVLAQYAWHGKHHIAHIKLVTSDL